MCNDDRLREKRGKDKDDDDDHPDGTKKRRCEIENKKGKQKECVVQDRSRSKAAQLKEESRKKEQSHRQQAAALTPQGPTQRPDPGRGFVELLTRFNSMLPEERRITVRQYCHATPQSTNPLDDLVTAAKAWDFRHGYNAVDAKRNCQARVSKEKIVAQHFETHKRLEYVKHFKSLERFGSYGSLEPFEHLKLGGTIYDDTSFA